MKLNVMNDYVVGKMYVATAPNDYIKLGEPVKYLGIVECQQRFLVKWEQCIGHYADGVKRVAGYDEGAKTYALCLNSAEMKPFKGTKCDENTNKG